MEPLRKQDVSDILQVGLRATGTGLVATRDDGRVILSTPLAEVWLRQYFGWRPARRLPATVLRWLRGHHSLAPTEPLVVRAPGCRLFVRRVVDGRALLLLLRETRDGFPEAALGPLGLSRRQTEVLSWMAQGKTDREMSVILGISIRTIHHHVSYVLAKLSVETRLAAAAAAHEMVRS
jgi:DNA-binding CsgD family transcriptional regulator